MDYTYAHYLDLMSDSFVFSDAQLHKFADNAAKLLRYWQKHKNPVIEHEYSDKNLFTKTGKLKAEAELAKAIFNNGGLLIGYKDGCDSVHIFSIDKPTVVRCRTGRAECYDDLVVALYALVELVSDGCVIFTSQGDDKEEKILPGLQMLKDVCGFDIDSLYIRNNKARVVSSSQIDEFSAYEQKLSLMFRNAS